MNILARHIKALLLTHDHVSLPQFGTFFTDRQASGREQDDVFMPVRRILRFTPEIDNNDTLLVRSIADTYHLTIEQAEARLADEIANAGQTLGSTGMLDFDTLGTFNLVGGRIVFEACKASFIVPSMYGLDAISMPVLPTLTEQQTKEKKHSDGSYVIRLNRELVHYAACIAATILLFFVWGTPVGNQGSTQIDMPNLSGMFIPYVNKPDLETLNAPKYLNLPVVEGEVTKESEAAEPESEPEATQGAIVEESSYVIVLASGVTQSGAENFVSQLQKEGYDKARVVTKGRMTRVVYGSYDTEAEAQSAKKELRGKRADFSTIWVLKI